MAVDPTMNTAADAWEATLASAAASVTPVAPALTAGDLTITATISGAPSTVIAAPAAFDLSELTKLVAIGVLSALVLGVLFHDGRGRR